MDGGEYCEAAGVGEPTTNVPVPSARPPPVPAKVKVYSTTTAFAGGMAATNNAMARVLVTFGIRIGNPFRFPTT